MHVLDGLTTVANGSFAIQAIIEEELPAYFADDKTVDDVCKIIQNRAQTYVWEQR